MLSPVVLSRSTNYTVSLTRPETSRRILAWPKSPCPRYPWRPPNPRVRQNSDRIFLIFPHRKMGEYLFFILFNPCPFGNGTLPQPTIFFFWTFLSRCPFRLRQVCPKCLLRLCYLRISSRKLMVTVDGRISALPLQSPPFPSPSLTLLFYSSRQTLLKSAPPKDRSSNDTPTQLSTGFCLRGVLLLF